MKVRLNNLVKHGGKWLEPGSEPDLPDDVARVLIKDGYASEISGSPEVEDVAPPPEETDTAPPVHPPEGKDEVPPPKQTKAPAAKKKAASKKEGQG